MNLSQLITRIKMKLGIYTIALPIANLDEFIQKIIQDITIPVFSMYSPYYELMSINTNDLEKLTDGPDYQVFLLPEFKVRKLLFVENVEYSPTDISGIGFIGSYMPAYYNLGTMQSLMMAGGQQQLINQAYPALTFKYEHPRKLTLYNNISSTHIHIRLAFEHDKNLGSIPDTAAESFFKLAIYDVQENLYATAKHYNEIESAYGRVTLHIDDWQQAEENRKNLLEEWDNVYHMDLPTQVIWR